MHCILNIVLNSITSVKTVRRDLGLPVEPSGVNKYTYTNTHIHIRDNINNG